MMKMKKLAAMAMTGAMVLGTGATAFAAELPADAVTGNTTHDVNAVYEATAAADTIYSADITWGSMAFTYTVADEGTWNPQTHQYDGASAAGTWTCDQDANKVTVINHSNAPINAAFAYTSEAAYSTITGTLDKTTAVLATAEGTAVAEAPSASSVLTLSGKLGKNVNTLTKVGTVTVTLTEAE